MALIKIDPGQTKTVVALVGVLAVALGVTVVRLKPQAATQAADQTDSAQSAPYREGAAKGGVGSEPGARRARNPFERPSTLPEAAAVDDDTGVGELSGGPGLGEKETWTPRGWAAIEPAGPGSVFTAKPATKPDAGEPDLAPQKPAFTLLATAKGDRGFSGVIRVGESDVRVVEVGDVLEGGFKVIDLNRDRAVLTDGRETVVAKRPQCQ